MALLGPLPKKYGKRNKEEQKDEITEGKQTDKIDEYKDRPTKIETGRQKKRQSDRQAHSKREKMKKKNSNEFLEAWSQFISCLTDDI